MTFQYVKRDMLHFLSGSHYESKVCLHFFNALKSFFCKEFQAVFTFRVYNAFSRRKLHPFTFFLYQFAKFIYGIDIAPKAKIGPGLRIVHCSDIVIGPNVIIGNDCVLFNGTTMGKRKPGGKDGMPKVGNNVTIGTGAKLLGRITIGNSAKIGANSVVLIDVPENATAIGVPATVKLSNVITAS